MQLFEHLVEEMNRSNVELGLTKHRKIMTSFRDNSLFKIFKLTLDVSFKLADNKIVCPDAAMAASLAERVLRYAHAEEYESICSTHVILLERTMSAINIFHPNMLC